MKQDQIACAIYTRKSSEEGLEQGFNSLDAQREACAAYILSQKALGWSAIEASYDDGGFSGGNVERPGLKRLLADIAMRKVQVVVVYKVDRLTRSLADFAKMVELFDAQGVSFVSVTQQFNTTTSMGRLTLNVLLSFAQFEREVTGERIRDKIAASKRKGMWMGGMTPVGYVSKDRTLEIDEPQAQRIREMYQLYLELNCVRRLQIHVHKLGWLTPQRASKRQGQQGERPFSRGHLYRLLSNPVYAGKIVHKQEVFEGMHPAVVDAALWDAVQERLANNRQGQKVKAHALERSLLSGRVFDEDGQALRASHTKKGQRRYRYYIDASDPTDLTESEDANQSPLRVPANDLEKLVQGCLMQWLKDEAQILRHLKDLEARQVQQTLLRARHLADQLHANMREHLPDCVERVVICAESVKLTIRLSCIGLDSTQQAELHIPVKIKRYGMAVRLIVNAPGALMRRSPDAKLIAILKKSQDWLDRLTSGKNQGVADIAAAESVSTSYVTRVIYLSFLAPDIVDLIVRGDQPADLSLERLMRLVPLPGDWTQQRVLLGVAH